MDLVETLDDIKNNINILEEYRTDSSLDQEAWYKDRIKRGTCFYVYKLGGTIRFAPSRFIGYVNNHAEKHDNSDSLDGRITNTRIKKILGFSPEPNRSVESFYHNFCQSLGIKANLTGNFGAPRKFWIEEGLDLDLDELDQIQKDVGEIDDDSSITETEKETLVKARKGQGKFRNALIEYWAGCSITGCEEVSLLRASHIKPWKYSKNKERLDVYNGLLLTPNFDLLFDQGFISFSDDGEIMISGLLNNDSTVIFAINDEITININENHKKYLKFHRNNVFKKKA